MTPPASATGPASIVCSLEWAKKLKDLGWIWEDAEYVWFESDGYSNLISMEDRSWTWDKEMKERLLPAPTAEEILRRLPRNLKRAQLVVMPQWDGAWSICYSGRSSQRHLYVETSLSNVAAAMYVYLAENKLLPAA